MMETNEEEQEQAVVTSSSSPNSALDTLDKFFEKPENERVLTPELEQILIEISKSGCSRHPWEKVKPLFLLKLNIVLDEFNAESNMDKLDIHPNVDPSTFDELKSDIIERINSFDNAPFTIQRLCELILSPKAHYRRTDKFIRGLVKCVSVVTTIDNEGNKIYVEPSRNGLTTIESSETSIDSQTINGFAVPHNINDSDSINIESQETQAGSTTNTQLDDDMQQEENDEEIEAEDEEEEEEDKPSSSSSPPSNNLTDENSSSSNSNSTPLPSSSTEDMIEQ